MESQDKGAATKGEEVATSMLSRAKERAQPEARKIQLKCHPERWIGENIPVSEITDEK